MKKTQIFDNLAFFWRKNAQKKASLTTIDTWVRKQPWQVFPRNVTVKTKVLPS